MEPTEVPHRPGSAPPAMPTPRRRRGWPLEMPRDEVLGRIRAWSDAGRLFRVHHDQPGFYARARRLFGSWANALAAAGVDHARAVADARRRALEKRRRRHSGSFVTSA